MHKKLKPEYHLTHLEPQRLNPLVDPFALHPASSKRLKTSALSYVGEDAKTSLEVSGAFVTKKIDVEDGRHQFWSIAESDRLTQAVRVYPALATFINRALDKCQTAKERVYMVSLLEKELEASGPDRNWGIHPLPLLPREKLKNLSLALNGDHLQLTKAQNMTTLLQKPKEPLKLPQLPVPMAQGKLLGAYPLQRFVKSSQELPDSRKLNGEYRTEAPTTRPDSDAKKKEKKSRFSNADVRKNDSRMQIESPGPSVTRYFDYRMETPAPASHPALPIRISEHLVSDFKIKKKEEPVRPVPATPTPQDYKLLSPSMRKNNKKSPINPKKSQQNLDEDSPAYAMLTQGLPKAQGSTAPVVGTCQDLEKQYVRLTGLPNHATIRPRSVLEKSLVHIITKHKKGEEDHLFVIDQFRSIRQVA
jgi:hypothetical protein